MSDIAGFRVRWTVALWGPRAADDPEHSIAGSGTTPEEAIKSLEDRLQEKADLLRGFGYTTADLKPSEQKKKR